MVCCGSEPMAGHFVRAVLAFASLSLVLVAVARVSRGDEEDVEAYRKAAEKGDVDAAYNLGVLYATGKGVKKDEKEAAKWYEKAAAKGDAGALTALGITYRD